MPINARGHSISRLVTMSTLRSLHFGELRGFKIVATRGNVAYELDLPSSLSSVHNVFHVSQLKKCLRVPTKAIPMDQVTLQPDLSYVEYPLRILDEKERKMRNRSIKFIKVQWTNHSEDEATWELEDKLRVEYPDLFSRL